MEQFAKLYKRFATEGLDPTEQLTLTHMYDRMELSKQNDGFYDNQRNSYYITFSREELSGLLNVSLGTVTRVFKSLRKKGWIIIKQRFNASNRIFLPISLECKNETSKVQDLHSKHTEHNHTDKTIYTSTDESDTKHESSQVQAIDKVALSLITKSGLSPKTVQVMKDYADGNATTLYNYANMIFTAKNRAFEGDVDEGLKKLEHNYMINEGLDNAIFGIMRGATAEGVNTSGYLFCSFQRIIQTKIVEFSRYIRNENINKPAKKTKKTEIPMFKIA